jgi:hypothetical protein
MVTSLDAITQEYALPCDPENAVRDLDDPDRTLVGSPVHGETLTRSSR